MNRATLAQEANAKERKGHAIYSWSGGASNREEHRYDYAGHKIWKNISQ